MTEYPRTPKRLRSLALALLLALASALVISNSPRASTPASAADNGHEVAATEWGAGGPKGVRA